MTETTNCSEPQQLHDESWKTLLAELKTELESACGRTNILTETILDDWKTQIQSGIRDGQAIIRQITMQAFITDYVINERINGTMSDVEFKRICDELRNPNGLDSMYAKILHLLAGSSVAINEFSISEDDGAH